MEPAGALAGLRIVAFESRRAAEIEQMLARHGASVAVAPALREVPLAENPAALDFVARLEAGEVDAVVLLTGVGTRALVDAVRGTCPAERLVELLRRVPIVARGPKPVAALRSLGLAATVLVPEPNTWRELLETLDRELPVAGLRVAVQEYGKPNEALVAGLRARGADVLQVPVYRWALPHDLAPLEDAVVRLARAEVDVAVLTTAVQLDHLLQVAGRAGLREDVLRALRDAVVVAAIGPTAAEALAAAGAPADLVPAHPKLGYLVAAIAEQAPRLVAEKRAASPAP
jgi:uroporphyrinogen-III synthase